MSIEITEEDRSCDASLCQIEDSEDSHPLWIQCDCGGWFHVFCVGLSEPNDSFVCNSCSLLY